MKRSGVASVVLVAVGLLAPACTGPEADGTLVVFAAASLADAFADLAAAFEAGNPGIAVTLNLAASSALREQILAGAPADVFASAGTTDMDHLAAAAALGGEPQIFARNRMVIAVPAGNPAGIIGLADFGDPRRLIGLCATEAPCGRYARAALASAGVVPAPDSLEPDVRALLTKIQAAELDAGIVYATDVAAAASEVEAIAIPAAHAAAVSYPIAALAASPREDLAAAFVGFVLSARGQALLAARGFEAP